MDKQVILNVLNNLEVIEQQGGEDAYILVSNDSRNREELNAAGVSTETLEKYGDEYTFCILALAFGEGYCDEYRDGKFVLWGPIDDDLRYRVLNGEGTAIDAERLLKALEPSGTYQMPRQTESERYKEALEWYAEPYNYSTEHLDKHGFILIDQDGGERARKALGRDI